MPLLHDGSDEGRSKNIATLVREKMPEKQAIAVAYSIQRRARGGDDTEEVGKADLGPLEEENRAIRRNMQKPEAHGRHAFRPAKWTAGNGHPRCMLCGDEEPAGGECMGIHGAIPTNNDSMAHIAKADRGPEFDPVAHRSGRPGKEPTPAQMHAGNYTKTHWTLHGLRIAIENLAGTKRSGVNHKGEPWEKVMPYHYGYIKGTEGADGDHLDVAVGPLMDQGTEAHIINQRGPSGEFDEHKVFIGYPSRHAAIHAFRDGRSDDPDDVMGSVVTIPIEELKRWVDEGCLQEEAVLKAETSHVKAHYRIQNGRVVYVPNYDRTVHGEHPEANIHERSVQGANRNNENYIRATDAEDRGVIIRAAQAIGIPIHAQRQSGANHHGRQGAYPHVYFENQSDATRVMREVAIRAGTANRVTNTDAPRPPTRGRAAVVAALENYDQRLQAKRRDQEAASAAAVLATSYYGDGANGARNRFFGFANAGILDRRVYLENTTAGHNKLYVIDLRQVGEGQWVVNAGNGRIDGRSMTIRTKTDRPMSQAAANALVSRIKGEKMGGGYISIEDSATPRHRFTMMDNFSHPMVNTTTPLAGEAHHAPGVSIQTPARPATPAPAPPAAAAPTGTPAAAPTPARAAAAPTMSQYNILRDSAFSLGNVARNSENSNTPEGFLASMKASQAHAAAAPVARALGISESSSTGASWHRNRAEYWLGKAKQQWTATVTPALARNGAHSAIASGHGFADAVRALEGSHNILAQRPAGAPLPTGVSEADYASAVSHQDATLKALKIGQELEQEVQAGTSPGSQADGMTITFSNLTPAGACEITRHYTNLGGASAKVSHSYFAVPRGDRGESKGKKLFAASLDFYERIGIKKITVHANIDVGSYAWARYRFIPNSAQELGVLKMAMGRFRLTEKWKRDFPEFKQAMDSADPRAAWVIVDKISEQIRAGTMTRAENPLLNLHWHGHINMKDAAHVRKVREYVGGGAA